MTMEADLERATAAVLHAQEDIEPPLGRDDGQWQIYRMEDPAGEPSFSSEDPTKADSWRAEQIARACLAAFFRSREPSPEEVEVCARALWNVSVYGGYDGPTREMEWVRNASIYRSQARAYRSQARAALLAHAEYMVKVLEK